MGAWKDWEIGCAEGGMTARQITAAARRIQGTPADPLIRRTTTRTNQPTTQEHQ